MLVNQLPKKRALTAYRYKKGSDYYKLKIRKQDPTRKDQWYTYDDRTRTTRLWKDTHIAIRRKGKAAIASRYKPCSQKFETRYFSKNDDDDVDIKQIANNGKCL